MNYDTTLFIEIIESFPGIIFLRQSNSNGIKIRFYQGLRGNLVQVDYTDEDLTNDTAKGYLLQLGLEHLIPLLFPEKKN